METDSVQSVAILGSTGSVGQNTLAVLALHPERYELFALSANTSADLLLEQCKQFHPRYAVLKDASKAVGLAARFKEQGLKTELLVGEDGLSVIASDDGVDTVMAAIVGGAGLSSTMAAVNAGKKVLLANKESLVMAGQLFMTAVERPGAVLLPIDSEHNAIFQCMPDRTISEDLLKTESGVASLDKLGIKKILLTGSGGPFRQLPLLEFSLVTPSQACAHPNWSMGKKISVDSATMMNKGLELIEACWMFSCAADRVDIVVHPQSVIHSMVEYVDGSVLAQLGHPDMRTPIAHGLAFPSRMASGVESLSWSKMTGLTFEEPDTQRFPMLALARIAATERGSLPIVLNAANEVAVDEFLHERIKFSDIPVIIERTVEKIPFEEPTSFEEIQQIDLRARQLALASCTNNGHSVSLGTRVAKLHGAVTLNATKHEVKH